MKISTLRRLQQLFILAPNDETRPYLNGIHCYRNSVDDSRTVGLVVTNGHYLTQQIVEDESFWKLLEIPLLVKAESKKDLDAFLKAHKNTPPEKEVESKLETLTTSGVVFSMQVLKLVFASVALLAVRESTNYPKFQVIIPNKQNMLDAGAVEIAFNPEYLLDLWKANYLHKAKVSVKLTVIPGNKSPMLVTFTDVENNNTVLMPIKI